MTEFTQLYLTPKIFLMGSSLAFSLKEDPVRCAKVCNKSWVILLSMSWVVYGRKMNLSLNPNRCHHPSTKYHSVEFYTYAMGTNMLFWFSFGVQLKFYLMKFVVPTCTFNEKCESSYGNLCLKSYLKLYLQLLTIILGESI